MNKVQVLKYNIPYILINQACFLVKNFIFCYTFSMNKSIDKIRSWFQCVKFHYWVWFFPVLLPVLLQCESNPTEFKSNTLEMPEKKTILLANGETYAYIEQMPANNLPGDETFILIHGNFASSLHFFPILKSLHGLHIIAPDLRGFGDSTYNNSFSSLSELAEDIKLFADALNITKVHVIGWSLGGGIALELAVKYPELVSSLFLIQGMSYTGFPVFKIGAGGIFVPYSSKEEMSQSAIFVLQNTALLEANAEFFKQSWNMGIYNKKKPSAAENRIYISETLKQRCLLDVYWALAWFNMSDRNNGYTQGTDAIINISCPVTFTCAANDLVVIPAIVRGNAAAVPGSKLLEYKKCGHSPMVDCPLRLAKDIMAHAGLH
jgi:pimeloyl-ACP methyl ester carboxylesterase